MPARDVPLPPRDDQRIRWNEDVLRFRDTDANQHVNNTTFSEFCESGRVLFFRTYLPERGDDRFFVIANFSIDYRAELHYPGIVRTGTWVSAIGRSSISFRQMILAQDGSLAAQARSVCVQMGRADRRPLPFTDEVRAAVEGMLLAD